MTHRIADLVFGAVAQGYPERALACSQGTSAILTLGGQDPRTGQRYVSYETLGGGMVPAPIRAASTPSRQASPTP